MHKVSIALAYARQVIEDGLIDSTESIEVRAEQIEVEVEFAARKDGRRDATELGRIAREWYEV